MGNNDVEMNNNDLFEPQCCRSTTSTGLASDWPRPAASLDALARLEADQCSPAPARAAFSDADLLAGLASD